MPNVLPRYVHFVLACPAMTGLFLVWLFRRRDDEELEEIGFPRAELIRKGYQWAFWPTVAQFIVGPVTLLTLPDTPLPLTGVWGVFGFSILVSTVLCLLLFVETRRSAETIGRSFGGVCVLMLVVVALMGVGRHMYREAAVGPHRELVKAKTKDYMDKVEQARREAATKDNAR